MPDRTIQDITDKTTGHTTVVVFDDTPGYFGQLSMNQIKVIYKLISHVQLILLARPGNQILFSAIEMQACLTHSCYIKQFPLHLGCEIALNEIISLGLITLRQRNMFMH